MQFKIDGLGDNNAYLELKHVETWLELGAGHPESHRRAVVLGMNRKQALAIAAALKSFAAMMD